MEIFWSHIWKNWQWTARRHHTYDNCPLIARTRNWWLNSLEIYSWFYSLRIFLKEAFWGQGARSFFSVSSVTHAAALALSVCILMFSNHRNPQIKVTLSYLFYLFYTSVLWKESLLMVYMERKFINGIQGSQVNTDFHGVLQSWKHGQIKPFALCLLYSVSLNTADFSICLSPSS